MTPFMRAAILWALVLSPIGLRVYTAIHTKNAIVIVNNNTIAEAAKNVEEVPAEKLPAEPSATIAASDETVASDEEEKADDTPIKEVSVNGSTKWAKYIRTPEQREVQRIIKKSAQKYGVDWKIGYGICLKESSCNRYLNCAVQTGNCDHGQSLGSWQIYQPWNRDITNEQAWNFEWATDWSFARLKRNEFLGEYDQIRSHNGLYGDNHNAGYVEDVKKLMSIM